MKKYALKVLQKYYRYPTIGTIGTISQNIWNVFEKRPYWASVVRALNDSISQREKSDASTTALQSRSLDFRKRFSYVSTRIKCILIMAIRVVEFSNGGYKIRKINILKGNHGILRIGLMGRCQKLGIILESKVI